jgi:hypothetical protein
MKTSKYILGIVLAALMVTSCVQDLDVKPQDPDIILAGNLGDDPEYVIQFLGKVYGSFNLAGQGANGGADITSGDENFFTTMRALWNLQEITTDEAICAWSDVGIADLNTQTWSPNNPFLTALYQRLGLSITFANEFINYTKDSDDPEIMQYNAEARFLRALAYSYAIDLFGQFPFTTEEDGVGTFFPEIATRQELFTYVETELRDIEDKLGEPAFSYPQADKAAAWMLLAKLYLNAEVYTGTERWDDCVEYCTKVEQSGQYSLNPNYRHNFTSDNDGPSNPEMIFAWEQDGVNAQGYIGTTFIIQSCSDPIYLSAVQIHELPFNPDWNGNRARKDFMNIMVDTIATYEGDPVPATDTFFRQNPDSRIYMRQKESINIPSSTASGDFGVGVYKFTNQTSEGEKPASYNVGYASTDYPIFRYADALMMRAEANFNLGNLSEAAADINAIRERAFGDDSQNVTGAEITPQLILNERGREFYYEGHRRTDLIRHGQFTGGDYLWQWKGGTFEGVATGSHRDLFPIPGDEVSTNPNYNGQNNPGY